jgi:hypothetical protein
MGAGFRERAPQLLNEAGIPYQSRNGGAHLMVGTEVVDYWPGTGQWHDRRSGKKGRGINSLMAFMRGRDGPHGGPVTPFNPSPAAIERVPPAHRIPLPTECPKCGGPVAIENNRALYGSSYGRYPWCVMCKDAACGCAVGFHPETNIPLGIMADRATRTARSRCKDAFNPLWMEGALTRNAAYEWLAKELGIPPERCHIGLFDIEQCNAALAAIERRSSHG